MLLSGKKVAERSARREDDLKGAVGAKILMPALPASL